LDGVSTITIPSVGICDASSVEGSVDGARLSEGGVVFDGLFDGFLLSKTTTVGGAPVGTSASVGCGVCGVKKSRNGAIEGLVSMVVSVVGCISQHTTWTLRRTMRGLS
jgi:hypothetical protein